MGFLARAVEFLLDALFPLGDSARIVRECSPDVFLALLSPRVTASGATALLPYRHRLVRAAIIEAKFHRNEKAFALLGAALTEYLASCLEDSAFGATTHPYIVPIPLGPTRGKQRGYNQVLEIAKRTRTPVAITLMRTRDTEPQTRLSRGRRLENMTGAFRALPLDSQATYIVVDDVTTTGATLAAAKAALTEGGATSIELLALAH